LEANPRLWRGFESTRRRRTSWKIIDSDAGKEGGEGLGEEGASCSYYLSNTST
jgi:hypothetical protein